MVLVFEIHKTCIEDIVSTWYAVKFCERVNDNKKPAIAGFSLISWRLPDSNRPPSDCEPDALPDELNPLYFDMLSDLSGCKNTTKSLIRAILSEIIYKPHKTVTTLANKVYLCGSF